MQINSSRDASAVTTQIARLASERIGLSETATYLEFTAAAAGGLDHYSAYLTADQLRDIYSQIEGNFVGLGVELKADNGALLIVRVIPRSPAEKAGIKADDRIVAVDGQATNALSTDEAAAMLTGTEGSLVRVAVVSPGQAVARADGSPGACRSAQPRGREDPRAGDRHRLRYESPRFKRRPPPTSKRPCGTCTAKACGA